MESSRVRRLVFRMNRTRHSSFSLLGVQLNPLICRSHFSAYYEQRKLHGNWNKKRPLMSAASRVADEENQFLRGAKDKEFATWPASRDGTDFSLIYCFNIFSNQPEQQKKLSASNWFFIGNLLKRSNWKKWNCWKRCEKNIFCLNANDSHLI